MAAAKSFQPQKGDALVLVDVQNDFLPGGSLAVGRGDEILPVLNQWITTFENAELPIFATRDWHPPDHSSFKERGGIWPVHCVAETHGANFSPELQLSPNVSIVSKATVADSDAYSGFEGTDLNDRLKLHGVRRLFVGGLATDYCVLNTVRDALKHDYEVVLLEDGIRAVNVQPDDGQKALDEMKSLGATPLSSTPA